MVIQHAIAAAFDHFAKALGSVLLLAGLILPGIQAYDALTCQSTLARVSATAIKCRAKRCLVGKCIKETVNCAAAADMEAMGATIERKRRVEVGFVTLEGLSVKAWTYETKLNLTEAKVGDEIAIQYRRSYPQYVTSPILFHHMALGLGISLAGALLLNSRRMIALRLGPLAAPGAAASDDIRNAVAHAPVQLTAAKPIAGSRPGTVSRPSGRWTFPGVRA